MTTKSEEPAPSPPEIRLPVAPGQLIGDRYLIGEVIGEGGMGIVCAATHVGLGTPVAIKLISSELKHDPESVLRFVNEAKTAASLKGEHIARVYDVGQLDSGEPYLVMEQLEGIGLDDFIRERGALSQEEAVDIVLQACEGLAEAHAVALVHRDIKPANLFLARRPDGRFVLKILDFGISKRLLESAHQGLTDPGKSLGSPWYMSPEQMMNPSAVDQRADVWSLGVLLFQLLTNEYPFGGESVPQVCGNVLTAPAPSPSTSKPDIDPGLDAVVLRCLEKETEKRYASVAALSEGLRPFASRAIRSSALGMAETQSSGNMLLASSSESLAPILVRKASARSPWFFGATALCLVLAGAVLAGFGLPFAKEHGAFPRLATLARAHLPWDPELNPGPLDDPPMLGRAFPSPRLQPSMTADTSEPNRTPDGARALEAAPAEPLLTPAESRSRVARYRSWQQAQGLDKPPADDEPSLPLDSEQTAPSPHE